MALRFLNSGYFAGKLGIGTESPDTKLSISDILGISGTGNNTYGQVDLVNTQTGTSGDEIGPFITFRGKRGAVDATIAAYGAIGAVNTGLTGNSTGALIFLVKNTVGASQDLVEQMRISTGGNVGIGVNDPQAKLEVKGTSATPADGNEVISVTNTTGGSKLLLGVAENSYGWIQSAEGSTYRNLLLNPLDGNVGIGTTLPKTKLNIVGGDVQLDSGQMLSFYTGASTDVQNNGIKGNDVDDSLRLYTGALERVTIKGANVGIGTAGPESLLHIKGADPILLIQDDSTGTAQASSTLRLGESGAAGVLDIYWDIKQAADDLNTHLEINHSSNGNAFAITDNLNVGIGTLVPRVQTEVQGLAQQTSNISDTNNSGGTLQVSDTSNLANAGGTILLAAKNDNDTYTPQASIKSLLQNGNGQGVGDLAFSTRGATTDTTLTERMRVTSDGIINVATRQALKPSTFGYNSSYKTLVIGSTSANYLTEAVTLAFNVDVGANTDGGFTGNGSELLFRNIAKFITPNATNTGYVKPLTLNNGKVGIGTQAPNALLEVDSITYSATNAIANFVNGNNPVRVSYDTVVIAQTDVPCLHLVETVDGSQANEQKLSFSVGDGKAIIRSSATATDGLYINVAGTNNAPGYNTADGLNAIRVLNNGNSMFRYDVGVGTTTPQSRLQVDGGIQMADDTDTASATKVGTMRYRTGTEYVEVTGTELITNGDFATDTGWTKGAGWTIANGIASLTAQGASSSLGSTVMTVTSGNTYKVVIDVISTSTGFRLYDTLGVVAYGLSVGKNTFYRTVSSTSYQVTPLGLSGASGSIESVSVIEVTAEDTSYADMCMQTGASTYEWVNIVRNTY